MKKALSLLLLILMTVSVFSVNVFATEEPLAMDVYVTVSDENGALVLAKEPVHATDVDGDGVLTVNDALLAAHDAYCKDGYYASDKYGDLEITMLWGVSDRAYGVFNNGGYVWRLTEYLADDDHIQAFIYTDSENLSDAFSYFSRDELTFENGKESLTLYAYTVTEDNNLLSLPSAGAIITVNGKDTGIKTDKNGNFSISPDDLIIGEKNVISARSDRELIVPPVLVVTTDATDAEKSSASGLLFGSLLIIVIILTAGVFAVRLLSEKKKTAIRLQINSARKHDQTTISGNKKTRK